MLFWSVFLVGLNIGEYGPEKTQYLGTFHRAEPKGKVMFHVKELRKRKERRKERRSLKF